MPAPPGLRVALLGYRGNSYSGGQGVYLRQLSAALTAIGHRVTVISGQPYPALDAGVELIELPGLDLYRSDDPFRTPRRDEFRDWVDALEFAQFKSGTFPEPLAFSLRARRLLLDRRADFDVVHDNQCLGWGVLGLHRAGVPVVATVHHAVVVDRDLELARAATYRSRIALRLWYRFHAMQDRVARQLPRVITVSEQSRRDIVERMGVSPGRVRVIPVAVDTAVFSPRPEVARSPGRVFAIASADIPLKGVVPLLHAIAALRRRRPVELVLLGQARPGGPADTAIRELGLGDAVRLVHGIDDDAVAREYAQAEVAVVPSLYEGFSLPALQAMACGLPLVATTAGALPEVTGEDGESVLLVPPGDSPALAQAIGRLLDDPALRRRLGAAALRRARDRFGWEASALATAAVYREVIGGGAVVERDSAARPGTIPA